MNQNNIKTIDFPPIIYTKQNLKGLEQEAIWKVWIDFIIEICKAIDPHFQADSSNVIWQYGTIVVGYFDYTTVSINGFLNSNNRQKTIQFYGECDLQWDQEGKDNLGFWIDFPEIPKGRLSGKIFYLENPHLTDLRVSAIAGYETEMSEKVKLFLDKYVL